jgi:hypothetical protein
MSKKTKKRTKERRTSLDRRSKNYGDIFWDKVTNGFSKLFSSTSKGNK